jgi:hypothetical protein
VLLTRSTTPEEVAVAARPETLSAPVEQLTSSLAGAADDGLARAALGSPPVCPVRVACGGRAAHADITSVDATAVITAIVVVVGMPYFWSGGRPA